MMMTRKCIALVCVTTGLVAIVGCNRDRDRTGATTTTTNDRVGQHETTGTTTVTGANIASATAIDRVVAARCERETTCKNVGADKKFTSSDACRQKLHADMKDDLNAKDCPHGIDQKELNECLESIRKEDCGNPVDSISRIAACRTSDLCLSTSPTNR